MNVILTGLRGTGKSSIGQTLARRLGLSFLDTDTAIESLAGHRVSEIVAQHGWEHFRALERQVIQRVATLDRQVVAAGGGTLMDPENARLLKAQGLVILLVCALPVLQRRIALSTNRPSLTGQGSAAVELAEVWEARRAHYYAAADMVYDVSGETTDPAKDVQRKAAAIEALLRHTPRFREAYQASEP